MKTQSSLGRRSRNQQPGLTGLDTLFSALSDSTRRGILERLASREMTVTDIARPYRMSLPAVSKHLSVLETAGLIVRRREGRTLYCQINATPFISAASWIGRYKHIWENQLNSLGSYLDDLKSPKVKQNGRKI